VSKLVWITKEAQHDITDYVQSITWRGAKGTAPRSLEVTLINTGRGLHEWLSIKEGHTLLFMDDTTEYFRGTVFTQSKNQSFNQSIKAYDQLIYLVKNKNSYVFTNQTATQIIQRLCGDYQIPMGEIKDTGYRIPALVVDGETLYDIAYKAIYATFKQTGRRFYLGSSGGSIYLAEKLDQVNYIVIEDEVNLLDFTLDTSIEDSATSVVMVAGEEKSAITIRAKNDSLAADIGTIQYYEKVTDKLNSAQLQERVNKAMADKGKVISRLSISCIGDTSVMTGTAIHLVIRDMGIWQGYYVDSDSHVFKGNSHTMSIELSETDELPEVEIKTE
jgi:hypothetical protein